MRHDRYHRASLMVSICALIIVTTPLLNLLVHAAQDASVLSMGAGLFLFWMALILLTVISNRFHKKNATDNGTLHEGVTTRNENGNIS